MPDPVAKVDHDEDVAASAQQPTEHAETVRTAIRSFAPVSWILATFPSLIVVNWIVHDLAGKSTTANVHIGLSISIGLSVASAGGTAAAMRSRGKALDRAKQLEKRNRKLEDDVRSERRRRRT